MSGDTNWGVTGLIRDDCLNDHLGLVGTRVNVGVGDSQLSGYERSTFITKVPVEGDVCVAEVLTGVVEGDGEGDCPVLDEAHVPCHNVIHLVQRDSEGNLIYGV